MFSVYPLLSKMKKKTDDESVIFYYKKKSIDTEGLHIFGINVDLKI